MALHPRFDSAAARYRQREMAASECTAWPPFPSLGLSAVWGSPNYRTTACRDA
jgi:hypothetical protein